MGLVLAVALVLQSGMTVQAGTNNYLDELRGGVAVVLEPGNQDVAEIVNATAQELNLDLSTAGQVAPDDSGTLVMANVKSALNVREDASQETAKVGKLYKDCGGTILERRDGWTKLRSGNVIGWASDEYLLFGEEALALANDVGKMIATVNTETLRVRTEPSTEAGIYGLLPKGEILEVISQDEETGWICIDYEGEDGYVSS